jgi:NADH dehydrogenase (ubiquinone) Fe-S protein 2
LIEAYEKYNYIEFGIPIGMSGDCYDRALIRLEEMRESLKIINECLSLLNIFKSKDVYSFIIDNTKVATNSRSFMRFSMENLIHHYKLYSEGFFILPEETYSIVEAPKGEFGIFLVTNGSNYPFRCSIKAPGFLHLQGLNFMSSGNYLADLVTIIGTQDLVFGEIDR